MSAIVAAGAQLPPQDGETGRGVLFDIARPPRAPRPPGGRGPWWLMAGLAFLMVLAAAAACTLR